MDVIKSRTSAARNTEVIVVNKIFTMLLLFWLSINSVVAGEGVIAAENEINLGTQKPLDSSSGAFLNLVYSEAFKRLGITFKYQHYPARRSTLLSNSGVLDGELSRIHYYNENHPNMIRVEEPHWTSGFIAVAVDSSIQLNGWDSLRNQDFKVLYVAGIKGCEVNLPKVVRPENLDVVMQNSHAFRMLLKGRADLFIGSEMDLVSDLESEEFRSSPLKIVGVMEQFTGHAFLHQKHQTLVPKVSAILKEMKQEGLLDVYRKSSNLKYLVPQDLNGNR